MKEAILLSGLVSRAAVRDEITLFYCLLRAAEDPSAIKAATFLPARTLDPSGRRIVTSREEDEVLESRGKAERSGPGDSAPVASNSSVNEPRLAIIPTMNLRCIKGGLVPLPNQVSTGKRFRQET